MRHCLHARQQGADRRTEHDLQFIVARTGAFDRRRAVCVVRAQQRLSVEADLGVGIQPIEAQFGIGLGQRHRIHVKACAVLPGPGRSTVVRPPARQRTDRGSARGPAGRCTLPGTWARHCCRPGCALRVAGQHAELPLRLQRSCSYREGGGCNQQQEQADNEGRRCTDACFSAGHGPRQFNTPR